MGYRVTGPLGLGAGAPAVPQSQRPSSALGERSTSSSTLGAFVLPNDGSRFVTSYSSTVASPTAGRPRRGSAAAPAGCLLGSLQEEAPTAPAGAGGGSQGSAPSAPDRAAARSSSLPSLRRPGFGPRLELPAPAPGPGGAPSPGAPSARPSSRPSGRRPPMVAGFGGPHGATMGVFSSTHLHRSLAQAQAVPEEGARSAAVGLVPGPAGASVMQRRRTITELLANRDLERITREKFEEHDADKSGSIDFDELRSALHRLHLELGLPDPDPGLAERLLKKFDVGGAGQLKFDAFFELFLALLRQNAFDRSGYFGRDFFVSKYPGSVWDRYEKVAQLGKGTFGTAFLVKQKFSGEERVVKVVKKSRVQIPVEDVEREILVMRQVDHPHIVRLRRWYEDRNNLYLVMDALKGGTLRQAIFDFQRQMRPLKETWARTVIRHCVQGMAYCHSLRLIHKDLKDENIMLLNSRSQSAPDEEPFAVIIDLGIAEMFSPVDPQGRQTGGTPVTMAPEVWRGNFGPKCDVWSLGCVLFELLAGGMPFVAHSLQSSTWITLHKRGPDWTRMRTSPAGRALCRAMLTFSEADRPTMRHCLDHEWFRLEYRALSSVNPQQFASLHAFCRESALKRTLLLELAARLPMSNAGRIVQIFKDVDTDGDGRVSRQELKDAFAQMGLHDQGLAEKTFKVLDLDGDGQLSFTEFSSLVLLLFEDLLEDRLFKLLAEFDGDHEAMLSSEGARRFLEGLSGMLKKGSVDRSAAILDDLRKRSRQRPVIAFQEVRDKLLGPSTPPQTAPGAQGAPEKAAEGTLLEGLRRGRRSRGGPKVDGGA